MWNQFYSNVSQPLARCDIIYMEEANFWWPSWWNWIRSRNASATEGGGCLHLHLHQIQVMVLCGMVWYAHVMVLSCIVAVMVCNSVVCIDGAMLQFQVHPAQIPLEWCEYMAFFEESAAGHFANRFFLRLSIWEPPLILHGSQTLRLQQLLWGTCRHSS